MENLNSVGKVVINGLNSDIFKWIFPFRPSFLMSDCLSKPFWLCSILIAALSNQKGVINASEELSYDRQMMPLGPCAPPNDLSKLRFQRCLQP